MNVQFENFISWLYCPNNNMTIENIAEYVVKYNYPYDIIIMKYIQLLCFNGLDNNAIQEHLLTQLNITTSFEIIEHIRKEEQHDVIIPAKLYDVCIKNTIQNTNQNTNQTITKKKQTDAIHSGYPYVHPTRGRPQISWTICHYENCMKWCVTEQQLLHHLQEHNCLTHHFHKKHEIAIKNNSLTPQKILMNNIIHCPSPICDVGKFNSPAELIKHLTLLGIEPFWKYGVDVKDLKDDSDSEQNYINSQLSNNFFPKYNLTNTIFRSEYCVCCCETKPQIVYTSCKHSNMCLNCYEKLTNKKCPECRTDITNCLPY